MQVKEMIIEVRNQMQSLSSNTGRKLQDEEIVWILNTAVNKIISDAASQIIGDPVNFSVDSLHYQRIANLVVHGDSWPIRENPNDDRSAFLIPKSACAHVLSAEAVVSTNCRDASVIKQVPLYIGKIVLPEESSYNNLTLTVNGSVLFDSKNLGVVTSAGKFSLINQLIQALETYGYSAYWKVSPYESAANTLFIVSTTDPVTDSNISYKVGDVEKLSIATYNTLNYNWKEYPTSNKKRTPVITKDPSYRSIILANPFHKPSKDFGIMFWSPLKPEVFYPSGAIYNAVELTYVRKSRIISLLLDENSDLTDHQYICDVAAQLAMKNTQNPGYTVQADYTKATN